MHELLYVLGAVNDADDDAELSLDLSDLEELNLLNLLIILLIVTKNNHNFILN